MGSIALASGAIALAKIGTPISQTRVSTAAMPTTSDFVHIWAEGEIFSEYIEAMALRENLWRTNARKRLTNLNIAQKWVR